MGVDVGFQNKYIAITLSVILCACGNQGRTDFQVTPDGVKSLDKSIESVEVIQQVDGITNYVDMKVKQDPVMGGQSDWNVVAGTSHRLMSALFVKPEVSRVRITFVSPDNNNFEWSQVRAKRDALPQNWQELTYLQFFARTEAVPGSVEVSGWLCQFYAKYSSAVPSSGLSRICQN